MIDSAAIKIQKIANLRRTGTRLLLTVETADGQSVTLDLGANLIAELVPLLLSSSPPSSVPPFSFASRLRGAQIALDQEGNRLLSLFFPSSIPLCLHLGAYEIKALQNILSELIDLEAPKH